MITIPNPLTRDRVIHDMSICDQMPGLSVLAHGQLVREHYLRLVAALEALQPPDGDWRPPDWFWTPGLLDRLLPDAVIEEYQVHHDCGKPYCVQIGEDGRRHFPDHAAVSERVWLAIGGDPTAARLMRMDMDAHLLTGDQVEEFAARPEAVTLLLTALAEVHANATMFGGTSSTSFKIKSKHLARRGKQVLARLSG